MKKLALLLVVAIIACTVYIPGAIVIASKGPCYISDLDGTQKSGLAFDIDGESTGGIKIVDQEYDKGIIVHPDYDGVPSEIEYDIEGLGYDIFYAVGGKDASAGAAVGGESGIRGTCVQMQVLVDGELKADSGMLKHPDIYEFKVDITGAKKLSLLVYDADGLYCDTTAWANAQLLEKDAQLPSIPTPVPATPKPTQDPSIKDQETVYISDMVFSDSQCWTDYVALDCNISEEDLYISGEYFDKGISFHAIPSGEAYVDLDITDMGFKTFTSYIGMAESMSLNLTMGTIKFRVYCDGELKYESELKSWTDEFVTPELVTVDITDVKILRLAIDNAGDGHSGDLGNWGGACISKLTNPEDIYATPVPTATPEITKTPVTPTPSVTTAPTTAPNEKPEENKDGCGSSSAIAQVMLILGAALIIKKRK